MFYSFSEMTTEQVDKWVSTLKKERRFTEAEAREFVAKAQASGITSFSLQEPFTDQFMRFFQSQDPSYKPGR